MNERFSGDDYIILFLALALIVVTALWQLQESPQEAYERGKVENTVSTREAIRFGFTRGGYELTFKLSESYNLPRDAYLAWEYSICEGLGEMYLVQLGGAIGDSTWLKQYIDGTICEECLWWHEANREMVRPLDSTDTMPAVERVDTVKSKPTLYLDSNWLRRLEIEEEVRGDERP